MDSDILKVVGPTMFSEVVPPSHVPEKSAKKVKLKIIEIHSSNCLGDTADPPLVESTEVPAKVSEMAGPSPETSLQSSAALDVVADAALSIEGLCSQLAKLAIEQAIRNFGP